MILVYPLGVPALYLALLYTFRGRINPSADSTQAKLAARRDDAGLAPFAFLFKYYRPERWWFEVADALRRVLLIGGLVFVDVAGCMSWGVMGCHGVSWGVMAPDRRACLRRGCWWCEREVAHRRRSGRSSSPQRRH